MNSLYRIKIKYKVFLRKKLLNILLLFFSPRRKFIISISQDLDKYIVLYQHILCKDYSNDPKIMENKDITLVA